MDKLIAFLGSDDSVIELRRARPNLLRLVQWFKDDPGDKEVIYIWQSEVSKLIEVLKQARQGRLYVKANEFLEN